MARSMAPVSRLIRSTFAMIRSLDSRAARLLAWIWACSRAIASASGPQA
jgi:hypothetical protein